MTDLVLLGHEVALLKVACLEGILSATGELVAHEAACDFFCESGLAERCGEAIRLTTFGKRVARKLLADRSSGTMAFSPPVLKALESDDLG